MILNIELHKFYPHNIYDFYIISKVKSIEEFFLIFDRLNLKFEFEKLTVMNFKKIGSSEKKIRSTIFAFSDVIKFPGLKTIVTTTVIEKNAIQN